MINESIRHIVDAEIIPGEKLLWVDKSTGKELWILLVGFIFFIVFTVGFIAPIVMAISADDVSKLKFDYNGIPANQLDDVRDLVPILIFAIISVLIYVGLCIWLFIRFKSQIYAVTDARVIIICTCFPNSVKSLSGQSLGQMVRTGNEKRGTLTFLGSNRTLFAKFFMPTMSYLNPKFLTIQSPRDVEALIQKNFLSKGNPP